MRLTPEQFQEIFSKVPRLCVDVFITDEYGNYLLTRRTIPAAAGMWHIPGGSVLYGETLEEAVRRVARDELGVEVEIIKLMPKPVEFVNSSGANGGHAISLSFNCRIAGGEIKLNHEASEFAFFGTPPEDMIPEQVKWLNQI